MVDAQPVNPMERFNQRFSASRQKKNDNPAANGGMPDDDGQGKVEKKVKKINSTNDLSQLGSLIQEHEEERNKKQGDGTMADTFTLTEIQKKACEYLGIDPAGIKDEASMLSKFDGKILIQGNKIIDLAMEDVVYEGKPKTEEERKEKEATDYALRDDGLDPSDLPSKDDELHIHEGDTPTPPPVPIHEPTDALDWIDEKVKDYEGMKSSGNTAIKSILPNKPAEVFTAEIDNGTVTYTSKNDVSITKDSSYKVFDTVMKEPSNAGKAIRIPEDATPEFKTNLFVAAVLNGHKVNGAEGLELDTATMEKIGLTPEQKAKVLAALPKKEDELKKEKPVKSEEEPKEKDLEVSKEVTDAIAKIEETKIKLAELIKDGKVSAAITSNVDTKKSEISFNYDSAKGGTEADANEANKLLSEAIKSVGVLRKTDIPEDKNAAEQIIADNYAIKSAQLDLIRSVYQPEQSEAVKAMDRIRAKQLGLTAEKVERDVVQRDDKGHIIYETNKSGKPLYKRDTDGSVMYQYKRDKNGHFIRDEKTGELMRDVHKPVLTAKTEKQEVETMTGTEHDNYQSKLSPAILARVKAEHESK